jgi:hypothetical protein
MSEKTEDGSLRRTPSHNGDIGEGTHDAVFGEITEDGPNYRAVRFESSMRTVLTLHIDTPLTNNVLDL